MSKTKIKAPVTYYLTLSQVFPSTHCRAGEPTYFLEKLHNARTGQDFSLHPVAEIIDHGCTSVYCETIREKKLHTIRANYDFWARRFEKIERGEAVLSIREWVGKPYGKGSTQREIARLTRDDGIGLQRLTVAGTCIGYHPTFVDGVSVPSDVIARNDGLSEQDWRNWFASYKVTGPLAVIQFTKFRYKYEK